MGELAAILREQKEILGLLVAATQKERQAILSRDLTELQQQLSKKEALKQSLCLLEERRSGLTGNRSLSEIAALGGGDNELAALREEMKDAVRQLQHESGINAILIRHELAYIRHIFELPTSAVKAPLYNRSGSIPINPAGSLLFSGLA